MCKNSVTILVVALAILLVAPSVLAQEPSPTEVVQNYYTALSEAAASGDTAALLDIFADDATVDVAGITPGPVQGKEAIQSTLGNMFALLQGVNITLGDVSMDGNTVTTTYTLSIEGQEGEVAATDTFVIENGLIQSVTITIDFEALPPIPVPYDLPQTGGPVLPLLPGLLVAGGAALVGLSRRFSR